MKKIKLNTAKLQLHKEKVTELSNQEMDQVKGGFTSIGNQCSQDNSCARVSCPANSNCQSTFQPSGNN